MKYLSIVSCVFLLKICSGDPMDKCDISYAPTNNEIVDCRILYGSIEGIQQQALDDMIEIITQYRENKDVLLYINSMMKHTLIHSLYADKKFVTVDDIQQFFNEFDNGFKDTWEKSFTKFRSIILHEDTFSQMKARIITFFTGMRPNATSEEINRSLNYLHGPERTTCRSASITLNHLLVIPLFITMKIGHSFILLHSK